MSEAVANKQAEVSATYASTLQDQHVQEEFNVRTLHYLWLVRQAQDYLTGQLEPFANELRKRKRGG